jgi:hypothetical protein
MQGESNLPGYQVMDHDACIAAIVERERDRSRAIAAEYRLPNGRIADVIAISSLGTITIWEVKTRWRASELGEAWDKYARYCDQLWFVSLALVDADWRVFGAVTAFGDRTGTAGIMSYLGGQPHVYRCACHRTGNHLRKLEIFNRLLCPAG